MSMSQSSLVSIALLGLLLASPSSAEVPLPTPPPSEAASAALPDGFVLAPDGTTLIHAASGLRFPAEFEGYTRLRERGLDPSGDYIAIGYDRPLGEEQGRIVVRMAVVHIDDMPARDHYLIMRQATMSHFSAPLIVSEGPTTIPTNPGLQAYRGTFRGYRDGKPWRFSLTTVNYGYWSGRMTAAYPESEAEEAEKYLGILLAAIRAQQPEAPKR